MNRKLIMAVVSIAVVLTAILLLVAGRNKPSPQPQLIPTNTPAANPELGLVTQLSGELAARFTTYSKPNAPDYYASWRPFVTEEFYRATTDKNNRITQFGSGAAIPAITSKPSKVEVVFSTASAAKARVTVSSSESGGQSYEQVVEIEWEKRANRWVATSVSAVSSTRKSEF